MVLYLSSMRRESGLGDTVWDDDTFFYKRDKLIVSKFSKWECFIYAIDAKEWKGVFFSLL